MAVFADILGVQKQNSNVQGSSWYALQLVAHGCPAFMHAIEIRVLNSYFVYFKSFFKEIVVLNSINWRKS